MCTGISVLDFYQSLSRSCEDGSGSSEVMIPSLPSTQSVRVCCRCPIDMMMLHKAKGAEFQLPLTSLERRRWIPTLSDNHMTADQRKYMTTEQMPSFI